MQQVVRQLTRYRTNKVQSIFNYIKNNNNNVKNSKKRKTVSKFEEHSNSLLSRIKNHLLSFQSFQVQRIIRKLITRGRSIGQIPAE